jgi:hypothetical protein
MANPSNDLADAVRNWVHFDNLSENLNKQVQNARTLRGQYEQKVLNHMDAHGMQNHTIRISGGATLQKATRFKSTDLSWGLLEDQMHEYYKITGKPDETTSILTFIQKHRGGKSAEYLKKTVVSQANNLPPTGNQPKQK